MEQSQISGTRGSTLVEEGGVLRWLNQGVRRKVGEIKTFAIGSKAEGKGGPPLPSCR